MAIGAPSPKVACRRPEKADDVLPLHPLQSPLVALQVLHQLLTDVKCMARAATVCRAFNEANQTSSLWKQAFAANWGSRSIQAGELLPSWRLQVQRELGIRSLQDATICSQSVIHGCCMSVPEAQCLVTCDLHQSALIIHHSPFGGSQPSRLLVPPMSAQPEAMDKQKCCLMACGTCALVITGHADGRCRVWDVTTHTLVACTPASSSHSQGVRCLGCDGDILVSCGSTHDVCVWRIPSLGATVNTCRESSNDSLQDDGAVCELQLLTRFRLGSTQGVQTVAVSAATNVLAVMTARCVEVYSCLNGKWQYCLDNYQNSSIIFVGPVLTMVSTSPFVWPFASTYPLNITLLDTRTMKGAVLAAPAVTTEGLKVRKLCKQCESSLDLQQLQASDAAPDLVWMSTPSVCFTAGLLLMMCYQAQNASSQASAYHYSPLMGYEWKELLKTAGITEDATSVEQQQQQQQQGGMQLEVQQQEPVHVVPAPENVTEQPATAEPSLNRLQMAAPTIIWKGVQHGACHDVFCAQHALEHPVLDIAVMPEGLILSHGHNLAVSYLSLLAGPTQH